MKEQSIKKIYFLNTLSTFIVLFLFITSGIRAEAATYNRDLTLDGNWTEQGEIKDREDVYFYKFTIPQAGFVTIDYQGISIPSSEVSIVNGDQSKEYESMIVGVATESSPVTKRTSKVLERGTYYVRVVSYWFGENLGTFRMRGSFVPAGNNETEPNDLFDKAMVLSPDQIVTGLISEDDKLDFYSFTLSEQQRIEITFTTYSSGSAISIWDTDYRCIHDDIVRGSEDSPKIWSCSEVLNSGTYYIKITESSWQGATGRYTITYKRTYPVTSLSVTKIKTLVVGNSFQAIATIQPTNATNKGIRWKSDNEDVASVDENGLVRAKSAGKAIITAYSEENDEIKDSCTVLVNPKKVASLKVKNKAKKKLKVSWKQQSGVSGYKVQYSTNSKFKKAKTKTVSRYYNSILLPSMKKKTYYVRVRAYYSNSTGNYNGAWSTVKKVKIKK